ncbi:adenylyltransferase/cytidyltransferase family protein [bacterium]|nr:adenylyltransferase/cytidyltransferase family protein [bacterium]
MGKLVSQDEAVKTVREIQNGGKTVVTTNGCYDILHVGHVRYLQKTKEIADYSVVMLNSDSSVKKNKGENRPINTELDRAEILCALSCVDYVVIFDEKSPCRLLDEIKPDFHTKGADYTLEALPQEERDVIIKNNIKVKFIDFVQGKSTTNTIEKMKNI